MSCPDSKLVSVWVGHNSDFATPELISDTADSRDKTQLTISTIPDSLIFAGTPDELLDFGAEIMRSVYAWFILSGHSEWLDDEVSLQDGKVTGNGTG